MININEINAEYVDQLTAAKMLNISRSRVNRLCNSGRFDGATKVGWSWLIPRVAVQNFQRLKSGPKPKIPTDRSVWLNALAEADNLKGELHHD